MTDDYGELAESVPSAGRWCLVAEQDRKKIYWTHDRTWSRRRMDAKVYEERRLAYTARKGAARHTGVRQSKIAVEDLDG